MWNHSLFCRGTPNKLTLPKVKSLFRSLREAQEGAKSWDTENYSTANKYMYFLISLRKKPVLFKKEVFNTSHKLHNVQ